MDNLSCNKCGIDVGYCGHCGIKLKAGDDITCLPIGYHYCRKCDSPSKVIDRNAPETPTKRESGKKGKQ